MIDFGYGTYLRGIDESDLGRLFSWRNDPKIWRWCRQSDALQWGEHWKWFESLAGDGTRRMYGVCDLEHRLIGCAGLTSIDLVNRRAEFSLYIGSEHQRKGFARKALKTLISHGFKNLGLHLIWGESFEGNPAQKLFEELGFFREGVRRDFYFRDGQFVDAHLFSVKASEWTS